jgi:heme-degrading monooxygenase HmoA
MPETTLRTDDGLVILINVFTVDPAEQQHLIDRWQQATDEVIRHVPGFVSANIHRSLDGTKVVNYAQWESQEAFQAMLRDPEAGPLLRELGQIATPAPVLCEVVSIHHAER